MVDLDAYRLDDTELDAIFRGSIIPILFGEARVSPDPLLILVGAQPGAGKTRAGAAAKRDTRQPIISILGDDLRPYHPRYNELMELDPSAMPDATAQASGAWVERCIEYAAGFHISVLVEGTFRDPAVPLRTIELFRQHGFRVQVNVVVVAAAVSRLSAADRFVSGIRANGPARFTTADAHNRAMASLPETILALHKNVQPGDQFIVRDRDTVLFCTRATKLVEPEVIDAIAQREWSGHALTIEQLEDWLLQADEVIHYLRTHYQHELAAQELVEELERDRATMRTRLDRKLARAMSDRPPRVRKPWRHRMFRDPPMAAQLATELLTNWLYKPGPGGIALISDEAGTTRLRTMHTRLPYGWRQNLVQ